MKRASLIATLALVLIVPTATANPAHHYRRHINACLRAHGWPYGLGALQHLEVRANHPNGLVRTCGGRDAV